jgi:hypothetical protein
MARTAVIAGTASAVSGNVQQKQAQAAAAQQQAAAAQQRALVDQAAAQAAAQLAPAAAAPAGLSMAEKIAQIRQLGELRDADLLTEEEFAAAKATVLAG